MARTSKQMQATPAPIAPEDSEPVVAEVEPGIKKASDIAGWLKTIGALGIGMFVAGGATYKLATRLETTDAADAREVRITAKIAAHASSPHAAMDGGPAITKEIEGIKMHIATTDAQAAAERWWIREAVTTMMRDRGLRPPPSVPTEPATIHAPR